VIERRSVEEVMKRPRDAARGQYGKRRRARYDGAVEVGLFAEI